MNFFESICPQLNKDKITRQRAVQCRELAFQICQQEIPPLNDKVSIDQILESTYLALENYRKYPPRSTNETTLTDTPVSVQSVDNLERELLDIDSQLHQPESKPIVVVTPIESELSGMVIDNIPDQPESESKPIILAPSIEPELSNEAKEIINLRDWVLHARNQEDSQEKAYLDKQLKLILVKAGLTILEKNNELFDSNYQKAIAALKTDNPDLQDIVCETSRPGYLFNDSLIRPQEVMIWELAQPLEKM
jgi:GrpE